MADVEIPSTDLGKTFDIATAGGLLLGWGFTLVAMALGGSFLMYLDVPSILMVLLGGTALVVASYALSDFRKNLSMMSLAFSRPRMDLHLLGIKVMTVAIIARKEGILALQGHMDSIADEPMLEKGLSMSVDGIDIKEVESMLENAIDQKKADYKAVVVLAKRFAEMMPAMGMIGTLVGLVAMLANLSDPNAIGPAMAVALLTTLYGSMVANMVFLPIAGKLELLMAEEEAVGVVCLLGVVSIAKQENPRRLEMLINTVLPVSEQINYFDE